LSAGIGATEEVIFAAENWRSHAALGGVVAHFQSTVREVYPESPGTRTNRLPKREIGILLTE